MSEQAHDKNRRNQGSKGLPDLSELHASKNLHEKNTLTPENQPDLMNASISGADVPRVTQRPTRRQDALNSIASTDMGPAKSPLLSSRRDAAASAQKNAGIVTNPTYRYQGGLASKVITFLANMLKVLERLFLGLLGARNKQAPRHQPQTNRAKQETPHSHKNQQSGKESQRQRGTRIHRS